jgi:tape measure domain-containing protein
VSVVANIAINIDAKNAQSTLAAIQAKVKELNGSFDQVKVKSADAGGGLGEAFSKVLGPLLAVVAAAKSLQEVTAASFDRAAAEQRIKALSSAYGEQTQVLALATNASKKFGITQTEASIAIADVYGRLRPLGLGLSEINSVYEGFNVVARQAGLSASESSSVFTQLAQALGSGVLRGDEFNRMAESMPGILGLVAEQLGVSQGALRGMAADGKITGDVVVKALQEAQKSAGDLTKYMTPAQIAMQELARNSQEVMVQLGNFAAPVVTAGMSALGTLAKVAADTFKYLNDVAMPKLKAALAPIAAALKPITDKLDVSALAKMWSGELVVAINLVTSVVNILAKPVAFVVEKFIQLSGALAAIDGRVALLKLLAGYFAQAGTEVDKYIAKQDAATKEQVELANASHSMSSDIAAAAERTAALAAGLSAAKDQATAGRMAIEGQVAALERGNAINQARYGAEQALNALQGAQLEREMSLATTAQQRADIAVKMFQQQANAAQIEFNMAMEAIKLDQQKQELAIGALKLKYQEIDAEGKLQVLKDPKNEDKIIAKMNEALASQKAAIDLAGQNLQTTQQTAAYQEQTAKAVLATKIVQAQLALEGKLTSDNIGMSQSNAVSLSNSLAAGVGQARNLASAMGQVAANAANAAQQLRNVQAASGVGRAPAPAPKPYASGGYVSRPTNAMIGEGGQPEYVVPANKAANFASNYLSGMRGNSAVQSKTASSAASYLASPSSSSGGGGKAPSINIQTGPVTQMNGVNYVTTQEMARAVQTGVRQTLNMLRNDGNARQVVGMA